MRFADPLDGWAFGPALWSNSFLPGIYQGTHIDNREVDPRKILQNVENRYLSPAEQRDQLDLLQQMNRMHLDQHDRDPQLEARIQALELAFRMQAAGPDLLDFSKESPATLDMYGVNAEKTRAFGTNCLLARRMVERGVRFVMLMHASWDQHTYLNRDLKKNCDITDGPTAALIRDLKQRGLLDSTLVLWGGEFGRTPMVEQRNTSDPENAGRDHHPFGYSMFMAGGGMKGGTVVGKTDELGFNVVEDKVHVHDLQATILNRLGFDHTRLTYKYMGREFRLTDVEGRVVQKMLV